MRKRETAGNFEKGACPVADKLDKGIDELQEEHNEFFAELRDQGLDIYDSQEVFSNPAEIERLGVELRTIKQESKLGIKLSLVDTLMDRIQDNELLDKLEDIAELSAFERRDVIERAFESVFNPQNFDLSSGAQAAIEGAVIASLGSKKGSTLLKELTPLILKYTEADFKSRREYFRLNIARQIIDKKGSKEARKNVEEAGNPFHAGGDWLRDSKLMIHMERVEKSGFNVETLLENDYENLHSFDNGTSQQDLIDKGQNEKLQEIKETEYIYRNDDLSVVELAREFGLNEFGAERVQQATDDYLKWFNETEGTDYSSIHDINVDELNKRKYRNRILEILRMQKLLAKVSG